MVHLRKAQTLAAAEKGQRSTLRLLQTLPPWTATVPTPSTTKPCPASELPADSPRGLALARQVCEARSTGTPPLGPSQQASVPVGRPRGELRPGPRRGVAVRPRLHRGPRKGGLRGDESLPEPEGRHPSSSGDSEAQGTGCPATARQEHRLWDAGTCRAPGEYPEGWRVRAGGAANAKARREGQGGGAHEENSGLWGPRAALSDPTGISGQRV